MDVLTIEAIKTRLQAMNRNRKRGFSMEMFAKFAGVDYRNLKKMALEECITMTALSQRKLSKALLALENGEAGMRMDIAGRKKLDFHPPKEYKPYFKRGFNLKMTASGFGLDVKPVNKYDYSKPHLLKK
jgi:hypothetical protein